MINQFIKSFLLFLLPFIALSCDTNSQSAPSGDTALPNVVLIFTDDQGYGDIGCFGATGFETPHLDHLASKGMK